MYYELPKKLGKFFITHTLISENPEMIMENIMPKVIIFRAEYLFANNVIEYLAYCKDFDELKEGESVPEYKAIFHRLPEDGSIKMHWERL